MCGVAGFLDTRSTLRAEEMSRVGRQMAEALRHRGPDDGNVWMDAPAGVVLAHRRLAIIDLSHDGAQPMSSFDGRYVISYNGEIYNFPAMRRELESRGVTFRGHSDTEVLLAAISVFGLETTLRRVSGMFAFALWDRQSRRLHLARDRFGEKPLYYGWQGSTFLFGSELKAFHEHPHWCGEIDRDALTLYMRHLCVPAPYSIYEGIRKLPPGTMLEIDPRASGDLPPPRVYWSIRGAVERGMADPFRGDEREAADELERLLREAVQVQMVSDVPLGAFLSGGIDSSTIVALMQAQSTRRVRTFTIGFAEAGFNEAGFAREIAAHLGTDHIEMFVSAADAAAAIPLLPTIYDEPFADSSQIPTYLLSKLTRQHVTVSLSGDGGDEVFGGYVRYTSGPAVWNGVRLLPRFARRWAGRAIRRARPNRIDASLARLLRRHSRPGEKLAKFGSVLEAGSPDAVYQALVSAWMEPEQLVLRGREPETQLSRQDEWPKLEDFVARMMYADALTYLPDDILTKVDRAAMAVSLETRVPFLDHGVFELATRLPLAMKVSGREGKRVLRAVLERHVPRQLVDRPKMGFGLPVDQWLRGHLRDWAEDLLDERRLTREGLLNVALVRGRWREHRQGSRNGHFELWSVLMLQAWLDTWQRMGTSDRTAARERADSTWAGAAAVDA